MNAKSLRRWFLSLAALGAIAFAFYGYYWHRIAEELRDGLAPWASAQQAQGYKASWDEVEIGGFPGSFRFRFTKASFGAERPLPVALDLPVLVAWAEPWNLHHWRFTSESGAKLSDALGAASVDLGRLDGSVELGNQGGGVLDVSAFDLTGAGLVAGTHVAGATAHIELPARAPATHLDTAFDLALQLSGITLPGPVPGFGNSVNELAFSAQLKGGLPQGPFVHALAQWRDQGGTIELGSFRLRWGALLIDASGTLALDQALQPEGALSAVITGQDAAVDLAVSTGTLQASDATIAKAVLDLLAKPAADGQKAITVPLTLQQDRLFLGPAAIAQFAPIQWE